MGVAGPVSSQRPPKVQEVFGRVLGGQQKKVRVTACSLASQQWWMCWQQAWVSLTKRRKPWKVLSHRNMSQGPVRMLPGQGGRLLCRQFSWHFCAMWSQWSSLCYLATSLHLDSQGGPFWPFHGVVWNPLCPVGWGGLGLSVYSAGCPRASGSHSILLSEEKDCSALDGLDFHMSGMHLALIRQEGAVSLT